MNFIDSEPIHNLFCPISLNLINDPAITVCNHIFEKHDLQHWLKISLNI